MSITGENAADPHPVLHVVIPANNEENYIEACLDAVLSQVECPPLQVIVAANACTDQTVEIAQKYIAPLASSGSNLVVLDIPEGGKLRAFNEAEKRIDPSAPRLFLDADIVCDPYLFKQLAQVLAIDEPRYATGTLQVAEARSLFTKLYSKFWQSLPFVQGGAVGAGCFAVNGAGRERWSEFPDIISDDTFVRLNFEPEERFEVASRYHWPMIEGFAPLVRVRRRQDAGVAQLCGHYPELMANEAKAPMGAYGLLFRAIRMPLAFVAYMAVHLAVRLKKSDGSWVRAR